LKPFGLGAYSYVEKELGIIEIRCVIARLAAEFRWRLDGEVDSVI
jgi:hypothetical protein